MLLAACTPEHPVNQGFRGDTLNEATENSPNTQTQSINSGFRPKEHGFRFANYTNRDGIINLTAVEMQRMFGDQVCANIIDGSCTLTPASREWMEKANQAMDGGHCEGMAVLSQLMYYEESDPGKFGASQTFDLSLKDNVDLQREIAYWWVTQATFPGASDRVNQSPSQIVRTLQDTFARGQNVDEAWVVGIYQPDMSGGHSITPIAVQEQGEGIFQIYVYDNNIPGEDRSIIVDTNADTWEYYGSSKPNESTKIYKGDRSTQTLEIVAITPRLEQQECSFCEGGDQSGFKGSVGEEADPEQEYFEIWLEGEANLHILNHKEQHLGFVNGKFVEEIPGASIHWMRRGPDSGVREDPIYRIPQGPAFEFFIDGTDLISETVSGLSVIAPGYFISIKGIHLQPGAVDQVSMGLREDGTWQLIYWPDASESPIVMAGIETPGADYVYRVRATRLESEEDELDMRADPQTGEFILNTADNQGTIEYDISVQRYDEQGASAFNLVELEIPPHTEIYIHYGDFEGKGEGFYALADVGMDGIIDETYEIIFSSDPFEWDG
ncbi:hypothetical protein ACFLXI_00495 [Chloroflexota bacterium]